MPKRSGRTGYEERVRALALGFADEIARAVRAAVEAEVAAEVSRIVDGIARPRGPRRRAPAGSSTGDRRIGKMPVPVACPVAGCDALGIRAKRNFCAPHAAALSDGEKQQLRRTQAAKRATPSEAATAKRRRRRRAT